MGKMIAVGDIVLGRYEVIEIIYIGGQGLLARGRDIQTGQDVAIKQFLASPTQSNYPELITRAEREAQIRIGHSKVVDPLDSGDENGEFFIIFPFVEGHDLATYLAMHGGKLPADQAASIVADIAEGLTAVHGKGFVHRDLKPENILIDTNGSALIVDFGISRDTNNMTIVQSDGFLGTIAYMSPEQVASPGSEDHRTDLYSLGVLFYQILTGQLPVQGEDAGSILVSICQYMPTSPRQLDASVPEHIDLACMRLLAKQREVRFQSAAEFIQALSGQGQASQPCSCSSCGQIASESSSYCTGCGAPLGSENTLAIRCLACGAPAPDAQVCPNCGRPFTEAEHRLSFRSGSLSGQRTSQLGHHVRARADHVQNRALNLPAGQECLQDLPCKLFVFLHLHSPPACLWASSVQGKTELANAAHCSGFSTFIHSIRTAMLAFSLVHTSM